tara:strand:- start:846 stop:1559 length:714 start_codon:yes stop_codon:yes gene_type:complete
MRLNYNFAFKGSKLREWQRPSPPNLLISDASFKKKIIYIYKQFKSNSAFFYPPITILVVSIILEIFTLYPNKILKSLEDSHNKYQDTTNKLINLNSAKQRYKRNIRNIDPFFSQSTTSYLFAFYLQNVVPKDVQINNYSFSDNGFELNVSSFSLDALNELLTLLIESPIIKKETVNINNLNKQELSNENSSDYQLEIYGETNKLDESKRESLYIESNAIGLLKKYERFKNLKNLLRE